MKRAALCHSPRLLIHPTHALSLLDRSECGWCSSNTLIVAVHAPFKILHCSRCVMLTSVFSCKLLFAFHSNIAFRTLHSGLTMTAVAFVFLLLTYVTHGFNFPRFGASWKAHTPKRTAMRTIQTSLRGLKDISAVAFEEANGRTFIIHAMLEGKGETEKLLSDDLGPYTLFLPQEECFRTNMLHGGKNSHTFATSAITHAYHHSQPHRDACGPVCAVPRHERPHRGSHRRID